MDALTIILVVLFGLIFVGIVALVVQLALRQTPKEEPWPYRVKRYLFSRSEHEFLHALHAHIDTEQYLIFPKVRLADFIEVTISGEEYLPWWNKIKSKHVDFLIWNVAQNEIALAIELDGRSHNSEKMRERDAFIDKLYREIGVKLEHVVVGSNFSNVCRDLSEKLTLAPNETILNN